MSGQNDEQVFARYPNYQREEKLCSEFLNNFEDITMAPEVKHGRKKYVSLLVGHRDSSKKCATERRSWSRC